MDQKRAYNLDNEGARARTWDLLLKRQLLYQLSYAPSGRTILAVHLNLSETGHLVNSLADDFFAFNAR